MDMQKVSSVFEHAHNNSIAPCVSNIEDAAVNGSRAECRVWHCADLEGLQIGQGCLEVQGYGLAVSLTLMQGCLSVLQLPLGLVQPPAQVLYIVILAPQLPLHQHQQPPVNKQSPVKLQHEPCHLVTACLMHHWTSV